MYNFDQYNVFLAIATNKPQRLNTGFVLQGHKCRIYWEKTMHIIIYTENPEFPVWHFMHDGFFLYNCESNSLLCFLRYARVWFYNLS